METIKCTMCGEEKPLDEFRTQRSHSKKLGTTKEYRRPYCKDCEAIEVRRQYLLGLVDITPELQEELNQINELYKLRIKSGLNTFGTRKTRSGSTGSLVTSQLSKLKEVSHE